MDSEWDRVESNLYDLRLAIEQDIIWVLTHFLDRNRPKTIFVERRTRHFGAPLPYLAQMMLFSQAFYPWLTTDYP